MTATLIEPKPPKPAPSPPPAQPAPQPALQPSPQQRLSERGPNRMIAPGSIRQVPIMHSPSPPPLPPTIGAVNVETGRTAPPQSPPLPAAMPPEPLGPAEILLDLATRANRGDAIAKVELRRFLDTHPEVWQTVGDVGARAEQAWIERSTGGDVLAQETLQRNLKDLKGKLGGEQPTAVERLLIDVIGVAWLVKNHADAEAARPAGGSLQQANFRARRAEAGQRRLMSAIRSLLVARALLAVETKKHPEKMSIGSPTD